MATQLWSVVKRYRVTLFFIGSYCVLNPVLYYIFGQAYLTIPYAENRWLVFASGPFSFDENITNPNVSFWQIVIQGFFSLKAVTNFEITALWIFLVEWFLPDGIRLGSIRVWPLQTYILSLFSTYAASWIIWSTPEFGFPWTGASITGVCFILTYALFYSVFFIPQLISHTKERKRVDASSVRNFCILSLVGFVTAYLSFFSKPLPALMHSLGLGLYGIFLVIFFVSYFIRHAIWTHQESNCN